MHTLIIIHLLISPQEGVGDTADSFAYDGHRVRKWNVSTGKYGEVKLEIYSDCGIASLEFVQVSYGISGCSIE